MKYAYAGDRDLSVTILDFLIEQGHRPSALLVTEPGKATHAEDLIAKSNLDSSFIFSGNEFRSPDSISILKSLEIDYIIGIHFPYLIPKEVLDIPKVGFLNLHPAYLPYNKGWHTPSWAIIEGTPYGATLHFMTEELDAGNIIHQKMCKVLPNDTANSLYQRVKQTEVETFMEAFPELLSLTPQSIAQQGNGTSHTKKQLQAVQEINLDSGYKAAELIDKLRGLTTNNIKEGAYFIKDGRKYFIQVRIEGE